MNCCNKDITDEKQNINELNKKINELRQENKVLRHRLLDHENKWSTNIDKFVDEWYEENKDNVDIGVIDFKLFKIDVFPDYLEKHIYKKILKILYSFLTTSLSPKDN
tara:strand:- start:1119 stop:1439 length:321 start_codon:yes stop_codon:yes gene_type:complete